MSMSNYRQSIGSDQSPPSSPSTNKTAPSVLSNGQLTTTTFTAAESTAPLVTNNNTSPQLAFRSTVQLARDNAQGDAVEGWPLLAKLMTEKPDFEAFPRYPELNIKNLLYYQVELATIMADLERQERADRDLPENVAHLSEHQFHTVADKMVGSETDQWDQVIKLRECLKGYNEALLLYAQVSALPSPSRRNMKELVRWIVAPLAGNFKVKGCGSDVWGNQYERAEAEPSLPRQFLKLLLSIVKPNTTPVTRPDLVAPRGRKSVDGMTRWIAEEVIPFWYNLTQSNQDKKAKKPDEEKPGPYSEHAERVYAQKKEVKDLKLEYITSYSGLDLLRFTSNLTTLFACMLPMAAIGILSTIETLSHRLALIASFTAVFCAGLMMLTEITRVQVFTATSAFLAVLVVFVQQGP
ncbi:putative isoleucyl-tRNA synthetase [Podospora fimiseda]|uniref:Isoleucyl-tRNA synthetase n=1 Tax=Podospora fimiseda TaxID=252190 RepID=A0AAN7BJC4_9PEZI|nr:putative isoleucyl-tRNA synthetase [Podospora fimiseda]